MPIEHLNTLDRDNFVAATGALYEHSPWIAALAWERRPFADATDLHNAMQQAVRAASPARQLQLIRAHPDLAGRLARSGALDPHSAAEQGGLGLDRLSDLEFDRFDALNSAYLERFGFPFVIAIRGQTRARIVDAFATRLRHDRSTEIETALAEIGKIAALRLSDLLGADLLRPVTPRE